MSEMSSWSRTRQEAVPQRCGNAAVRGHYVETMVQCYAVMVESMPRVDVATTLSSDIAMMLSSASCGSIKQWHRSNAEQ